MTTAASAIVANNTVTNVPYSGMTFGWLWGNVNQNIPEIGTTGHYNLFNLEIAYNFISDYNLCTGDGGAIYTLGSSTRNEDDFVNYMHHNYVHMTDESGKFYDGRFLMGYYHDNTSSNWLDFENVLISSMTGALYRTMPIYNQDIAGAQAFNNHFVDNYIIGFDSAAVVYNDATNFLEKHNNAAHDYLFTSVANLKANTAKTNDTIYYTAEDGVNKAANILTKAAPANAVGTVANIFATAGSTYGASTKVSGLGDVTGTAFDAKLLLDYETSEISITGAKAFTATFTCDDVATSIFVMAGDALKVPSIYSEEGYTYTFLVDGEEIDVENYVMPASDLAVTVTRTAIDYTVTVSDGTASQEFTANVGDTLTFDEAAFAHDGYITIYKVDGVAIDLATFTMPASDVKITVTYEAIPYTVTFTYEDGSSVLMEDITIGTKLTAPKGKDKTGYALVYYVDGEKINLSTYTTPAQDIVIEARYEAKTYDVKFYYDIEKDSELYATVKVKFGEAITLPEAPADFTVGDYVYSFESWKGYTEGMILDTEGASFVMKTTATAVAPEFAVGDINGDGIVDVMDIAMLTAYCAETLADPSLVLGNTDVNEDGISDVMDIAALTAMCAK